MMSIILVECSVLVFLFLCSAFFSSAETAVFSLDSIQLHRIRREHAYAADRLEKLLATPPKLLATILIGNTLVNVVAAALGYSIVARMIDSYAEAISMVVMTLLLLVVGEISPKRLALQHPERVSVAYSGILPVLVWAFAPLRVVIGRMTKVFTKEYSIRPASLTEDEFLTAVDVGEEEGVLDEDEHTMVDGIISLEEAQASDVMTPRVDLVGLDLDENPSTFEDVVKQCRFRYLPLYRDTLDNIEGLLDVLAYLLSPGHDLSAATIAPFHVPETVPLDTLLANFQRENRRVAIVADEYGGTAGLVTRGDLLEEIIDYVGDEREQDETMIEAIGDNRWMIDGSASLDEINHELGLGLEAEGVDRIAGWVSAQAEHIPRVGDTVRAQGCAVTIARRRRSRITRVTLEITQDTSEPDEGTLPWPDSN